MSARLSFFLLLMMLGVAHAEPPPRNESNLSIRNEVQLAIDKGLAHLESRQQANGTWDRLGTTGYVLLALRHDPRGGYLTPESSPVLVKAYDALERLMAEGFDSASAKSFSWDAPPAVLALANADRPAAEERGRGALGRHPWPTIAEELAFYLLALQPAKAPTFTWPQQPTGSSAAAWIVTQVALHREKASEAGLRQALAWLGQRFTLERNPEGEGVHQFYLQLSTALAALQSPDLTGADGRKIDVARVLAEKLINGQNANGSWDGAGTHWTEREPDLVTAWCVLTLEAVWKLL